MEPLPCNFFIHRRFHRVTRHDHDSDLSLIPGLMAVCGSSLYGTRKNGGLMCVANLELASQRSDSWPNAPTLVRCFKHHTKCMSATQTVIQHSFWQCFKEIWRRVAAVIVSARVINANLIERAS